MHIRAGAPVAKLTASSFDTHGASDVDDPVMSLDLAGVGWIEPFALVGLACCVDDAFIHGQDVEFTKPRSGDVCRYLSRMHIPEMFDIAGIRHDLPAVREQPMETRLVELRRFSTQTEFADLSRLVALRLEPVVTSGVLDTVYETLGEIGDNVLAHSLLEAGGWVAAQVLHRGLPGESIHFAIGDAGVGIRSSLESGGVESSSDAEAIHLALQEGVSRFPDRGLGLTAVNDFVIQHNGTLIVRSTQGKVIRTRDHTAERAVPYLFGTIVGVSLPCGRSR